MKKAEMSYDGRHAELYDLFYSAKDYSAEARFVDQCLQQYGQGSRRNILDLACGTGRHAISLERLGYQVTGLDHSDSMLRIAQANADKANSSVTFRLGDLRSLDLPPKSFAAAICLFDAIGYVATNEAMKQTLNGIHRSIAREGLFIFEFWHAAAMLRHHDHTRVRRWNTDDGEVVRISETHLDCAQQLAHVTYTVYEHSKRGTYTSFQETQTNRYFLVQEMAQWLAGSGFSPIAWLDGFSFDSNISDKTWHVIAVARAEESTS